MSIDLKANKHVMECGQDYLKRFAVPLNALEKSPYYQQYKVQITSNIWANEYHKMCLFTPKVSKCRKIRPKVGKQS